jgi:predicted secreted Zn-dependent protease
VCSIFGYIFAKLFKLKILARELNSRKSTIGDLCHSIAKSQILEINSTDLYNFDRTKSNFESVITSNFDKLLECLNTLKNQFGEMSTEVNFDILEQL